MKYLRAFSWSFLGCMLFFSVAFGGDFQQAMALGCVLAWAGAEIRQLRDERDLYNQESAALAAGLAMQARKRGRS